MSATHKTQRRQRALTMEWQTDVTLILFKTFREESLLINLKLIIVHLPQFVENSSC